jgi:hypothetical protein
MRSRLTRWSCSLSVPRRLEFQASLLMSREPHKGSRLIVLLQAIKTPLAQINYGTGKDVSDETIGDAGKPLTIEWLGDSFIDIPTADRARAVRTEVSGSQRARPGAGELVSSNH